MLPRQLVDCQTTLERQDLSRPYLAHHELESIIIVIVITIIIITTVIIYQTVMSLANACTGQQQVCVLDNIHKARIWVLQRRQNGVTQRVVLLLTVVGIIG